MTVMSAIRSAETEEAKNAMDRIVHARALLPVDAPLLQFFDSQKNVRFTLAAYYTSWENPFRATITTVSRPARHNVSKS